MQPLDGPEVPCHSSQQKQWNIRRTGAWLPFEDTLLREAVAKHGTWWVAVAADVGTRTRDQCAKRWTEKLNPELDHSSWSEEEDQRLLSLVQDYGHSWKFMANNSLRNRAPLSIKNRYSLLMRRKTRQTGLDFELSPAASGSGKQQPRLPSSSTISAEHAFSSSSSPSRVDKPPYLGANDGNYGTNGFEAAKTSARDYAILNERYGADIVGFGDAQEPCMSQGTSLGANIASRGVSPSAAAQITWDDETMNQLQQSLLMDGSDTEMTAINSSMAFSNAASPSEKSTAPSETSSRSLQQTRKGDKGRVSAGSGSVSSDGKDIPNSMEFEASLTCQRGKLKMLAENLINVALAETEHQSANNDSVKMTLRLEG